MLLEQLKQQIENSPFSETFEIRPGRRRRRFTIRGIFDDSITTDDNKKMMRAGARIIVFELPKYESGVTEVIARKKTFRILRHETDANIGSVLWLG